jgi:hypothetical protein
LRVDLVAEQSRLKSKFESLGERLLRSLQEGSLDTLKEDPAVVELVGAIEENKARIRELEKRCQKDFSPVVKKIDIHFFSEKTERSKVVRVSSLRPVWWIIGSAVAIGGFFWFSPLVFVGKNYRRRIFELYQQNQEIQETISDIRNTSSLAEKQIKASAALRDSAVHMGGTYAALAKQKKENSRVLKQTSSFSETYKTFRSLRDSLLANPERAAALPFFIPSRNTPIL